MHNLESDKNNRCLYCGDSLNPFYYFCLTCATPYKSVDNLVLEVVPVEQSDSTLIKQKAPMVWDMFWVFCVGVLIASICLHTLNDDGNPYLGLIVANGILFLLVLIYSAVYWRSLIIQFKTFGFFKIEPYLAIFYLVPLLIINYYYSNWMIIIPSIEEHSIKNEYINKGVNIYFVLFSFCLVPAIVEEIAFRGLIQHWLIVAIKPTKAIILSSGLFSALHFNIYIFPYLLVLGILFGWVKFKTNSLYPPIFLHFIHNLIVILFME